MDKIEQRQTVVKFKDLRAGDVFTCDATPGVLYCHSTIFPGSYCGVITEHPNQSMVGIARTFNPEVDVTRLDTSYVGTLVRSASTDGIIEVHLSGAHNPNMEDRLDLMSRVLFSEEDSRALFGRLSAVPATIHALAQRPAGDVSVGPLDGCVPAPRLLVAGPAEGTLQHTFEHRAIASGKIRFGMMAIKTDGSGYCNELVEMAWQGFKMASQI